MISPIEIAPPSSVGLTKTVRVPAGARKQLVFKLTNADGQVIDLREEVENPPAPIGDFSPERSAVGSNVTVRLRSKTGDLYGSTNFDIEGEILPETGFVAFILTGIHTARAGIYEATIGRFSGDSLVDAWPMYILVEPNAFQALSGAGPLTIPEIRLGLLDINNAVNSGAPFSNLLDDVEFSDSEIIFAMRRVIDLWNETPPPVQRYSVTTFPFRYNWLQGTVGELLLMGAARYRRNRLDYSAGGVTINDQSKADEYEGAGRAKLQEFNIWMTRYKLSINMSKCWVSSGF